jgi:hypothetical protein
MHAELKHEHFDVIVVGSGTCGATIARELARKKLKVLILERGGNAPLRESIAGVAPIVNDVHVGDKLTSMSLITTGGSTGIYFAVADYPPLETFSALGIDLAGPLAEARKELPLTPLPDEMLGQQSMRLKQSALDLGHAWKKKAMLIDPSKVKNGYSFEAKWKARAWVEDAVREGATLRIKAPADRVIVDGRKAVGVEYRVKKGPWGTETRRAYGDKIVVAAGSLATPHILRRSGLKHIADQGFYFEPGLAAFGLIPDLHAKQTFMGGMSADFVDDVIIGDGNVHRFLYRLYMLTMFKFRHYFAHAKSVGVGVKIRDGLGGELREDGRFHKEITAQDRLKLKQGEAAAVRILKNAGAKHIICSPLTGAGTLGGVVNIGRHVNANLETEYRNLYVCDSSIIPAKVGLTPTLTLICLGKHLSKHLLESQ